MKAALLSMITNPPCFSRGSGVSGPELYTDFHQVIKNTLAIQDHGNAIDTVSLGNCAQVNLGATVFLADRTSGCIGLDMLVADAVPNPLDGQVIRNSPGTVMRTESPEIDQRFYGYIEGTLTQAADPRRAIDHLEQAPGRGRPTQILSRVKCRQLRPRIVGGHRLIDRGQ